MTDERILINARGETARINLASAGRYVVALGRQTLAAPSVPELRAKAEPLGWTPITRDLSETRKADRLKMAQRLEAAMLCAGAVKVTVEPCSYAPQRIDIRIYAPGGADIHVDFDGESCQPNVHVAAWNTRGPVFLSPILGDVNPYHFGKMNVVGRGLEDLIRQLQKHMARFVDGSGYLPHDDPRIVAMCQHYAERGWPSPLAQAAA